MEFTTCKEINRITKRRNTSSLMSSSLKEHVRQKRNALTVLDKKYQKKKPLEEVDEDERTLLNLFLKKPGMTERTVFIYFRVRTNRSPWLIWQ